MDAAKLGAKQACPEVENGKPHLKGEVITGCSNVLVCGDAAARKWDWLLCDGAVHKPNFVTSGREELNRLHADKKIATLPSRDDAYGSTNQKTDAIEVYWNDHDDVDHIASTLVHEGTHGLNNERQRKGEVIDSRDEEKSAWDAQNEFFKEQNEQDPFYHPHNAKYDRAKDREKYLEDAHDDEYWDENDKFWEDYRKEHNVEPKTKSPQ